MITVNGRFLTQRITGAQRYAHEVGKRLIAARGAEGIQFLMPKHQGAMPQRFCGVIQQVGHLRGHPWEQFELGRQANRAGGVLWSPVNVGPLTASCHVVTIHDVFSIEFPDLVSRKFHWWYSFLLPRLASSAQHIITVSEYSKQRIVDRLQAPEEKVSVVNAAVDHRFSLAEPDQVARVSERYSLPGEFILTLSSLEPRKNLERVVNAWLRLVEEDRPPLVIAGGLGVQRVFGSYSIGDLRRYKGIQLLGYVPDEDLAALYSAATIFVYASLLEGFGLPPLEAMACGATVVTSNTSAMKETSGGLAFLVDPNSIESIANGIVEALGTKRSPADRDRLSEYVRDRFTWSNTADQIEKILEQYEEE